VPAPSAGVLTEILQPDGATVVAEQLIAKLDRTATPSVAAPSPTTEAKSAPAASKGASAAVSAAPSAAKLMAEQNLSSTAISGSGRDGRITKGDVLTAVATRTTKPAKSTH